MCTNEQLNWNQPFRKHTGHPLLRQIVICGWATVGALVACAHAPGQELLIRYSFDENSGNALDTGSPPPADGVLGATATRANNTPGGFSPFALDLRTSGVDSIVNAGDVAKADTLESFTLTTWLNLEQLNVDQGGNANVRLLAKQGPGPDFNGFSWNLNNPNVGDRGIDNFRMGLFLGGVDSFGFAFSTEDTSAANSWTFLAVTYDGTSLVDNMRFYVGDEVIGAVELGAPGSVLAGAVASTSGEADFGIGFSDGAPGIDFSAAGFQDDVRVYDGVLTLQQLDAVRLENLMSLSEPCDFNDDTLCNVEDLDLMFLEGPIAAGVPVMQGVNDQFDLTGDDVINLADRDTWLAAAATLNGFGSPYKLGDANVDGVVDGQDFIAWNGAKFTSSLLWSDGDFNADGVVDGQDFIAWNENKFTSSDGVSAVPEPGMGVLLIAALIGLAFVRRR